jgi:hypothetical protein
MSNNPHLIDKRTKIDDDYVDDPYEFHHWKLYGAIEEAGETLEAFDSFFAAEERNKLDCYQHGDSFGGNQIFLFSTLMQLKSQQLTAAEEKKSLYFVFINMDNFLEFVSDDKSKLG